MSGKWLLVPLGLLTVWVGGDLAIPHRTSLAGFDGHEVGRLETAMWRSYYGHRPVALFRELVDLMRHQYHLPFWRACVAAWHAARAAVVFQRGHNRAEYELALPNLRHYYAIVQRSSDKPFSVETAARLELEWWMVHRERAAYGPRELERSLGALQAAIFQRPENLFAEHARLRAAAMLLRDGAQAKGGVSERDWQTIADLLDASWVSLQQSVRQ